MGDILCSAFAGDPHALAHVHVSPHVFHSAAQSKRLLAPSGPSHVAQKDWASGHRFIEYILARCAPPPFSQPQPSPMLALLSAALSSRLLSLPLASSPLLSASGFALVPCVCLDPRLCRPHHLRPCLHPCRPATSFKPMNGGSSKGSWPFAVNATACSSQTPSPSSCGWIEALSTSSVRKTSQVKPLVAGRDASSWRWLESRQSSL